MLIKGPIPHRTRLYHILFGWHYASEKWWASQCCLLHALERYLYSLSFYMITFELFWAFDNPTSCSFHRILKNRNTSFVSKVKPFPELSGILLPEQCETSGGYWHKHKLEGALCSANLGFRKSIPRAINYPMPSKKLKVAKIAMSSW